MYVVFAVWKVLMIVILQSSEINCISCQYIVVSSVGNKPHGQKFLYLQKGREGEILSLLI